MLCALIMAGGRGTRFWPLSTDKKPKQFLSLIGEESMIQMTVNRLTSIIDINQIFICSSVDYIDIIHNQLPNLPTAKIILEPKSRNTAPCILLSTLYIQQIYKNATIVVLPSDHNINNQNEFCNIIQTSHTFINMNLNSIITIGISPTRPETGYGYIQCGDSIDIISNYNIYKVNKFIEKPNLEVAKKYLTKNNYLWNSGIFIFNSQTILKEFKISFQNGYHLLSSLPSIYSSEYDCELEKKYALCDSISFDYAIMEKSKNIFVIPANFEWDDIGTWMALERYLKKDEAKNIRKGDIVMINSQENIVYSDTNKKVFFVDIDELFLINTNDTLIVGKKDSLEKVALLKDVIK